MREWISDRPYHAEIERLRALADERLRLLRSERVGFEAEIKRLRAALWAVVQETSNDPQRIKDAAQEALRDAG